MFRDEKYWSFPLRRELGYSQLVGEPDPPWATTDVATEVMISKTSQPQLWGLQYVDLQLFSCVRTSPSLTEIEAFDE